MNILNATETVATVNAAGGTLTTEGTFAITSVNQTAGTVDFQGSTRARTATTVNLIDGTLRAPGEVLTVTALNDPAGKYSLVAS